MAIFNIQKREIECKIVYYGPGMSGKTTNLEIDLGTGRRDRRGAYVTRLLTALTGAEDALVVNNNAAAAPATTVSRR